MIKRRFETLQSRIDALSLRERAMIFVAASALLYFLWESLLLEPLSHEQKLLISQMETVRTEIAALDEQSLAIINQHKNDPNRDKRELLAELNRKLKQADAQINERINGLIEPRDMARILEQMLQKQEGLDFVRLENLGSEALVNVRSEESDSSAPGIFRHTLRLELEGTFGQTLAYLRALETLPWQFRWDEVKITMLKYPRANIVIKVHTLSLQEGWIDV